MRRCRPEWQGGMHHGTFKATARREVIAGHVLERSEDERLLKVMRAPSWLGIAKLAEAKLADVRNAAMENCCVSSQTSFRLSPSRSSPRCSVACPAAVSASAVS